MEKFLITILEFIEKNDTVIFTLIGVLLGAFVTFIGNLRIKRKELILRLREKVLDKRMQSHENIIQLSKTLRTMNVLDSQNKKGDLRRSPFMFSSKEQFDEWYIFTYEQTAKSTTWLSLELMREMNLFQDYIVNLYEVIKKVPENNLLDLGNIVREDFVKFSSSIEKLAYKLFEKDLYKLKLNSLKKWHKYNINISIKRLHNTELIKRNSEIENLMNLSND